MSRRAAVVALSLVFPAACSLSRDAPAEPMPVMAAEMEAPAPAAAAPMERGEGGGGAKDIAPMRGEASIAANKRLSPGAPKAGAPPPAEEKPAARLVHYNGFVKLKVGSPEVSLAGAAKLAEEAGGYVEESTQTTVTLRVPVATVREVFAKVQGLGDVVQRSLTAQDVTDAHTALALRLETLTASRNRLIALLARARDEEEKLELLREIRRLSESIDQIDLQLGTLVKLAQFSRLTVEVVPRQSYGAERVEEVAAFRWILELSPFSRDVAQRGECLKLPVPTGFVALVSGAVFCDHWAAEAADGAVIWTSRRPNQPEGDAAFWREAVKTRLGRDYPVAEEIDVGAYRVLRFVDDGEPAYRYLVAVRADGDELEVVEVYYPTAEHEQRYDAAVRAAIEGGAS